MEEKREAMTDIFPRLLIIEGQQIYEKLEICPLSLLLTLQDATKFTINGYRSNLYLSWSESLLKQIDV